jgi:hypothetical protein
LRNGLFVATDVRATLNKSATGHPRLGLQGMLRLCFGQRWFDLADAACQDLPDR